MTRGWPGRRKQVINHAQNRWSLIYCSLAAILGGHTLNADGGGATLHGMEGIFDLHEFAGWAECCQAEAIAFRHGRQLCACVCRVALGVEENVRLGGLRS